LLALTAFVGRQSRGMPIAPPVDERFKPAIEAGRKLFTQRIGQIDMSCAQCHDDNWGKHLASSLVPQGHPTGYPIYRLEWQGLGSLQRRLRNCIIGMRAEPFDYGAPGSRRARGLSDVARARPAGRNAGRAALEPWPESGCRLVDEAGERRADVPREHHHTGGGAILEHAAAADAGIVDIRIFGEIPVRIENLQQMMEHVAGDHRLAAGQNSS